MPPLYLIQWGVIGFFVLIHFIIGFLRGSSKSTYFSIVSLVLTVVTLWLVSKISLNLLFSTFISLETFIGTIQSMTGGIIPTEFIEYLLNPTISAVIIAIIDVVIKIVAFFLIYPFLKWSLTMSIFRPIWIAFIKKPLLKKQNERDLVAFEKKGKVNRKFRKSKKLKKPVFGRVIGGFMGAIRGFVVGFVFLIPVIVIGSFVSGVGSVLSQNTDGTYQLGSEGEEMLAIPSQFDDIIENIIEMNEKGLGSITSQIVIGGKSLDRIAFDMVFSADIIESGEKVGTINMGQEFEGIVGIAEVLISGGYLEDGFKPETISAANLPDIEAIMGHLGKSTLIQSMIPLGTKFAVINILPDYINGTNLYDREATKEALDNFTDIDWEVEFNNIYGIIEAVLEFGSYEELMVYANDPTQLLAMTPEEATAFTDIIRAFGELETLYILNAGIDFATSYESVQNIVSWVDQVDREAYLQDRLSFILDNPDFFVGDTGEISRIANFIESIFADEEVSILDLYEARDNMADFIALQDPAWFGGIIDELVQIELLINIIPLGLDYSLYEVFGNDVSQELADQISAALEETAWDDEIVNIGNIYQEVLKLGIEAILGDDPNYYTFIDSVAVDHMDSIRTIISYIFDESDVVNVAIEYASPTLIDQFISDESLKELVSLALISDAETGVVDFDFGAEINRILTMVETVYLFTTTEELTSLTGLPLNEQLEVVAQFGSLSTVNFERFDNAIKSMQIFDRVGKEALEYVKTSQNIEELYIPEEVSLGNDLSSLINFAYYAANYLHVASEDAILIEDIDFAPLLSDTEFRSYLLPTGDNHSTFLISNIAYNIMNYATTESLQNYITIPNTLLTASPEDVLWENEIANLLGAVFDLGAFFEDSDALTLSIRDIMTLSDDPMQAPLSLITQFADQDMTKAEAAFGGLDESLIFRHSISKVIENLGTQSLSFIDGFELGMPEVALEEGVIKENMFVELIWGISTLLEDANQTMGFSTVADLANNIDNYLYIEALNNVSDDTYQAFSSITLLRGLLSEVLLNESVQSYARDLVNNLGIVSVSDSFLAFERPDNLLLVSDLAELFISAKALQITPDFYYNPGAGIYTFLNQLPDAQLDIFFDATLIKEIFTFALTDELLVESLATLVNDAYYNVQAGVGLLAQINPDFTGFVASLGAQRDEDDYFDVNEIKSLIRAFKELDIASIEELNALSELTLLNQKISQSLVIEKLFESNWLYQNLNYAFTDEDLYNQLASILEGQILNQTGTSHTLTGENVSFVLPKYDMLETVGERAGMVKVSEIKKFLIAGTRVNWIGAELGAGAGIASNIANLLLEEGTDGIRHVDVVTDSNLIVAIFDKLLNFEYNGFGMDQILIDFGNSKLSAIAALDGLQLTKDVLHYDSTAYDANEVIKREEIAQLFESIALVDLTQTIGLGTFITLVDNDQLGDLLASKILHSIISNALTNADVQQFGVNKGNNAQTILTLPNDFFAIDPILLDGDLFKVEELENIFIALRALGLESGDFGSLNQDTFIKLVNPETEDEFGNDDFDRVFGANYIYILLDRAIALEGFSDFAVTTLGLTSLSGDPLSLNPPQTIKTNDPLNELEDGRLPKAEFRRLLTSVSMLGDLALIQDPAVLIDTMTSMIGAEPDPVTNEDEFDRFMSSDYLYYVISVLLQNQEQITVPIQAIETLGMYDGFIKRTEIRSVLNALAILEIADFDDFDEEDITVEDLVDIINEDESYMVQYLLSQAIIAALDPDELGGIVPIYAYEGEDELSGMLTYDELRAITDTLADLADSAFEEDNEEGYEYPGQIPLLSLIDLLSDPTVAQVEIVSSTGSIILKSELTKQILDNLEYEAEDLYEGMFDIAYPSIDVFTTPELTSMTETLRALAEDVKEVGQDAGDILLTTLVDLLSDPTVGQVEIIGDTNSLILKTELTTQMLENLEYDPLTLDADMFLNGDPSTNILVDDEIDFIIQTLVDLSLDVYDPLNVDDAYESASDIELTVLVDILSDPTVGQVEIVTATDSTILKLELTKQLLFNLEYDADELDPTIFEDDDPNSGILRSSELESMSVTLRALAEDVKQPGEDAGKIKVVGLTDLLVDPTVGQLQIIGDTNSVILKTELTEQLLFNLEYTADDLDPDVFAYRSLTKSVFTQTEIDSIVSTLVSLANDVFDPDDEDDAYESVDDLELTVLVDLLADPTVGQLQIIGDTNSIVLKTELTEQLLFNLEYDADDLDPDIFAYRSSTKSVFTDTEIDEVIDTLVSLANNVYDPLDVDDAYESANDLELTVLVDLLADPSVEQVEIIANTDSYVLKVELTTQLLINLEYDATELPLDAFEDNDRTKPFTKQELVSMAAALNALADNPTDPVSSIDPLLIRVEQVNTLKTAQDPTNTYDALDSYVIQLLISEQAIPIVGLDSIPDDGYVNVEETILTKLVIMDIIDALDIMAGANKTKLITDVNPAELTVGQVEDLHALNRPIVNNLINREIITALTQDDDEIPAEAYELDDPLTGKLKPAEVAAIVLALTMLGDENELIVDIDFELITVQEVEDVSTTTSVTIKSRITEQILVNLDYLNTDLPVDAYEDDDPTKWFKQDQIIMIAASLMAMAENPTDFVSSIDPDFITVEQVISLKTAQDPTNTYDGIDAYIIQMLISDQAIPVLGADNIPDGSYANNPDNTRLNKSSIIEIIDAIDIVSGPDKSILLSLVNFDLITIGQVQELHEKDGLLTNRLISNTIIESIGVDKVPASAHKNSDVNENLEYDEVTEMIKALRILAGQKELDPDTLTDDVVVIGLPIDPTIGQVKLLRDLDSDITEKLISDSIIDAVGVDSVPNDAYVGGTPGNLLLEDEVTFMIQALEILGDDGDPETDTDDVVLSELFGAEVKITIAKAKLIDAVPSVIIKQINSDSIVTMLENVDIEIPTDAYRTEPGINRLKNAEITSMINSLEVIAGNDTDYVDEVEFEESTFTVTMLKTFPDSLIMNRIISSGLIANMPNIPIESYLEQDMFHPEYKKDLLRIEINNVLDALTILGIDNPSDGDSIPSTDIYFTQLDQIIMLGTVGEVNEHPDGYSPIIVHILSTPMRASIARKNGGFDYGTPTTARRNEIDWETFDLLYEEVSGLIDALKLIGNVGTGMGQEDPATTTLFDAADGLAPETFGPVLLDGLIGLDTLAVYRMISMGIQDANIDTDVSYAVEGRNFDGGLPLVPVYRDIKIAEMSHVSASMVILGLDNVNDIPGIQPGDLKALDAADIETLVEAGGAGGPNTIIYYTISSIVDPGNNLFDILVVMDPVQYPLPADEYYVMDGATRVRLKRTSIADAIDNA